MDPYLTHYWPFTNGQMNDVVGTANMTQGALTKFTTDRFGNPSAALNLNGGWAQVPAGVYFNSPQITVTVWVYPLTVGSWARIFDFGNGAPSDNILFSFDSASSLPYIPALAIYQGSGGIKWRAFSSAQLAIGQWQFLAMTFDGKNEIIYINGIQVALNTVSPSYTLPTLTRRKNYIGQANWVRNGYSSSYIDDLRFYSIALTQSQIQNVMNIS